MSDHEPPPLRYVADVPGVGTKPLDFWPPSVSRMRDAAGGDADGRWDTEAFVIGAGPECLGEYGSGCL